MFEQVTSFSHPSVIELEVRAECTKDALFEAGKLGLFSWAYARIHTDLYPVSLVKYALDYLKVQARRGRAVRNKEALAQAVLDYQVKWTHGETTVFYRKRKAAGR